MRLPIVGTAPRSFLLFRGILERHFLRFEYKVSSMPFSRSGSRRNTGVFSLNVPLATLVLCLISCLDMKQQHDDKSKPADYIKPKLICIGDNKRQQPENDRPGSGQQHPDYPKSKTCFLEKQQQREYSRADQHAQGGVQREKVIAAHAGYNTEGDTVKKR